jgi:competence protein ComEC
VAVSAACGLVTAPISWFQFHQIPLLTVPANAVGGFAAAPMLALALACALIAPLAPQLAAALAWANGWLAAYLAACAHVFGSLPGAQVTSGRAAAALALGVAGVAAYAWRCGERARPETGLPPDGDGSAEDRSRAPAPAGADR